MTQDSKFFQLGEGSAEGPGRSEGGAPLRGKKPMTERARGLLARAALAAAALLTALVSTSLASPPDRRLAVELRSLLERDQARAALVLGADVLERRGLAAAPPAKDEQKSSRSEPQDALTVELVDLYCEAAVTVARAERRAGRAAEADAVIVGAWDRAEGGFRRGSSEQVRALVWRRLALVEPRLGLPRLETAVHWAFLGGIKGLSKREREERVLTALRTVTPLLKREDPEREMALDFLSWFFFRRFPHAVRGSFPRVDPEGFTELLLAIIEHADNGLRGQWWYTTGGDGWRAIVRYTEEQARSASGKARLEARLHEMAKDRGEGTLSRLMAGELLCRLSDLPIWIIDFWKGLVWTDFHEPGGLTEDYSAELAQVERAVALYEARDRESPWPCFELGLRELRRRSKLGRDERRWIEAHMDRGRLKTATPTAEEAIASLRAALGLEGADAYTLFKNLKASQGDARSARLHHLLRAATSKPTLGDPTRVLRIVDIWSSHFKLDPARSGREPVLRRLRFATVAVDDKGAPRIGASHAEDVREGEALAIEFGEDRIGFRTRKWPELVVSVAGWERSLSPLWEPRYRPRRYRSRRLLSCKAEVEWLGEEFPRHQNPNGPARLTLSEVTQALGSSQGVTSAADCVASISSWRARSRSALPIDLTLVVASEDRSEAPWSLDDWRAAIARSLEKLAEDFEAARAAGASASRLRRPYLELGYQALVLPDARIAAAAERLTGLDPKVFPRLPIAHQLAPAAASFAFDSLPFFGWQRSALVALVALRTPDKELRRRCLEYIAESETFGPGETDLLRPLRLASERGRFSLPEAMVRPAAIDRESEEERGGRAGIWLAISIGAHLLAAALLALALKERLWSWLRVSLSLSGCVLALGLALARVDLNGLALTPPFIALGLLALFGFARRGRSRLAAALLALGFALALVEVCGAPAMRGLGAVAALVGIAALALGPRRPFRKKLAEPAALSP